MTTRKRHSLRYAGRQATKSISTRAGILSHTKHYFYCNIPAVHPSAQAVNNINWNKEEEKRLASRSLAGDTQAFGSIIKYTERLVAQIVFKMIANPEDRKDIAQEVYLKAWKKLPSFRFESKLTTWIGQIAYTTCIDNLRKKKLVLPGNDHYNDEQDTGESIFSRLPAGGTSEEDPITGRELSAILKTEIEKLPPVYKTMIALYHQEELTYEEISQVTGLPAGTVKSYLFRARKTLKNNLLTQYKKEDLC